MVDFSTPLGSRAAERLENEKIIWLTTISESGNPEPNPVWFFWDGRSITIYSQPTAHKVKNISLNPRVSLNFQADDEGGNVIVMTGDASLDHHPSAHNPSYLEKYKAEIPGIGLTPETLASTYSVMIRILPCKLRGL